MGGILKSCRRVLKLRIWLLRCWQLGEMFEGDLAYNCDKKNSTHVYLGLSGGSSMRRLRSEDPHRHEQNLKFKSQERQIVSVCPQFLSFLNFPVVSTKPQLSPGCRQVVVQLITNICTCIYLVYNVVHCSAWPKPILMSLITPATPVRESN